MKKLEIKLETLTEKVTPPKKFEQLKSKIVTAFPVLKDFRWDFCYIDQDGDKIAVDQQQEYTELIDLLNQMNTNLECIIIKKAPIKQNVNSQIPQQNLQHSNIFSEVDEQQLQGNEDYLSEGSHGQINQPQNNKKDYKQKEECAEIQEQHLHFQGQNEINSNMFGLLSTGAENKSHTQQQKEKKESKEVLFEIGNSSNLSGKRGSQDNQHGQIKSQNNFQPQAQQVKNDQPSDQEQYEQQRSFEKSNINIQPERILQHQYKQINAPKEQLESQFMRESSSLQHFLQQEPYQEQCQKEQQLIDQNLLPRQNQKKLITIPVTQHQKLTQYINKLQNQLRITRSTSRNASNNTQKCLFCNGVNNIDRPYLMFSNITMCYSCDTKIDIKLKKRHFRPAQHQGQY